MNTKIFHETNAKIRNSALPADRKELLLELNRLEYNESVVQDFLNTDPEIPFEISVLLSRHVNLTRKHELYQELTRAERSITD